MGGHDRSAKSETRRPLAERTLLTSAGRQQIDEEVGRLHARMRTLLDTIRQMRENGLAADDERATALALLDELDRLEARLNGLEAILRSALAAGDGKADIAAVCTSVRVLEPDGEETTYTLVDPVEAAPENGRISIDAPLGQALSGHRAGDAVTIDAPAGSWHLLILDVGKAA